MQLIQKGPKSKLSKILGGSIKAQTKDHYVKLFEDNCFRLTFHIGTDKHEFYPN